jgi:hypothetical protein
MIKRFVLLSWLLATIINSELVSQTKTEIKNSFYDAESWILFEDYKEALPLYLQLLKSYPANANFKYRIGQCYINTPGEKKKAVSFLEDAVRNINPNYKEGKFNETGAPYDALYYLANAYRINNQLDKALETYRRFKKNLNDQVYDSIVVNQQIQSCLNAKELMNMPLYVKLVNLGDVINDASSDFNPVVSSSEDFLVFSRSEAFYDALLYSKKVNGKWSPPVNMNEILLIDKDLYPTSLSKDGKTLYLYSSAEYDGIIYTTHFENETWTPLVKLNDNINTKYWESHAAISQDNKKLYFTSNRKGTLGGLDIYVSTRDSTGDWGPAVNLGPTINTLYNEESPFLSHDDKTLFFSSRGHFNIGGYDIFYSTLLGNSEWSVPLNVGYPLNSTDDDIFFQPLNKGYEGFYAEEKPGGFGKQDIYRIEIFSDDHPRKFFVKGMVKVADLNNNIKDSVKISAMNIKNPNQTLIVYSNPETGEYEFELPHGDYQITYEGEGGQKVVRNIDLPLTNPSDNFVLPGTLLPKTDFVADLNVSTNKSISVSKGDTIVFPLKVEPKSTLVIEHWVGDIMVSTEKYYITDSIFNYKMVPEAGNNRIVFKLTDRFNNTTTADVFISRGKNISEQQLIEPEYKRIIAKEQVTTLAEILKNRSDDKLKEIISGIDIESKQFGNIDDLISYIKEEAAKKGIQAENVDKMALKAALMDNILTQAAVDYLARNTEGDLKKILDDLDIYKENLKTWTDLQEYIASKTGNQVTPSDLNMIAAALLAEPDPSISILREKILAYGEKSGEGNLIRQSVSQVDKTNYELKEKWLKAFYDESLKEGFTNGQMSELLSAVSSLPDTKPEEYMLDLMKYSSEPLTSALKSLDLTKEKITSPEEIVLFLLTTENKEKYPEAAFFKTIANLIVAKDIPAGSISGRPAAGQCNIRCVLLILLGIGLLVFLLIMWRRKKKKKQ